MRASASRINAYMACALAAKYQYHDRLPRQQNAKASFGTIVHLCLKHYFDTLGDYSGAVAMFKLLWANPAQAGVEPQIWPKYTSYASLRAKGLEILEKVHAQHRWQTFTVIGTEIGFLVRFGAHELHGYIDLLGIERSGTGTEVLKVIDFKTNSKDPSIAELALNPQFTTYAYAVGRPEFWTGVPDNPNFPGLPNGEWLWETIGKTMTKRCIWWSLWSGRQIDAGPRTERDFGRLYRVVEEIAKADEAGVHIPKIGEACTYCDYQETCAMDIPEAVVRLQDPSDPTRWI